MWVPPEGPGPWAGNTPRGGRRREGGGTRERGGRSPATDTSEVEPLSGEANSRGMDIPVGMPPGVTGKQAFGVPFGNPVCDASLMCHSPTPPDRSALGPWPFSRTRVA